MVTLWARRKFKNKTMVRTVKVVEGKECMTSACIFGWCGLDFDTILLGEKHSTECLCLAHETCLAFNHAPYPIELVTREADSNKYCHVAAFCCVTGLRKPRLLAAGANQTCCSTNAISFPFHEDFVPTPGELQTKLHYCFGMILRTLTLLLILLPTRINSLRSLVLAVQTELWLLQASSTLPCSQEDPRGKCSSCE